MRSHNLFWTTGILTLFFLGAMPASAQTTSQQEAVPLSKKDKERFESLSEEAAQYYAEGNFDKAISAFQAAYAVKPVSNILYNIGRIYERQGLLPEAISFYEKFVIAPNVDIRARQDAVERLKTLRDVLALSTPKNETEPKTTVEVVEPAATPVTPSAEPRSKKVRPLAIHEPDNTLSWVLISSGGAALVAGGVFAYLTAAENTRFTGTDNPEESVIQNSDGTVVDAGPSILATRRDAIEKGELYGILADASFAAGIVSAAIGVILLVTNSSNETSYSLHHSVAGEWGSGLTIRF
jgi:tetratricopeptide (TPR) repeat protein